MPKYDPNSKAEREAAAESDAGRILANMANATFDSVREQTERVFQLAAEIGGKNVELADLGDAFSTPGERQDFYSEVLKAAFLKKAAREDEGTDDADEPNAPSADVHPVEEPVKRAGGVVLNDPEKPVDKKR